MLDLHAVKNQDLTALSPTALAELASQMLAHIQAQSQHIDTLGKQAVSQAQGIKWRDAKIESILFQLARLKACRAWTASLSLKTPAARRRNAAS